MSRISMDMAEKVAKQEADRKFNKLIEDANTHISIVATEVFQKENKFPVIEGWLYQDGWVRECTSSTFYYYKVEGDRNKTHLSIPLIKFSYPGKCHSGGVDLKDKDGKVLKAIKNWEALKTKKQEWIYKVKRAILSLGTAKKVRESIPELAKYFEDKNSALVIVPTEMIAQIRKDLST